MKGGKKVQLHKLLSGISFTCILIGLAGTAGAIETGVGYITSGALIIIGALCGLWARYESGYFKRRMH